VMCTRMIEPTESETRRELDRFGQAMIAIHHEIEAVESRTDNVLKQAPHTATMLLADPWDKSYSRQMAAFPTAWTREHKFWPSVRRVDNAQGDRRLICTCPPIEAYDML